MSDKAKQPYIDLSNQDAIRYKTQCDELAEKGYFTLESGQKSTDLPPKKKRVRSPKKLGKRPAPNSQKKDAKSTKKVSKSHQSASDSDSEESSDESEEASNASKEGNSDKTSKKRQKVE